MTNLELWDKFRTVPESAQKKITGGRLAGMTDINPVWRMKALTEQFGPCGIGWKYTIDESRLEKGAGDEYAAFVFISLFVKHEDKWSEAIPGTGGSMFVAQEKNGPRTSDEAFKMALTDAISVSCKALGVGADVYWDKDNTKYTKSSLPVPSAPFDSSVLSMTDEQIYNYVFETTTPKFKVSDTAKGGKQGVSYLRSLVGKPGVSEKEMAIAERAADLIEASL